MSFKVGQRYHYTDTSQDGILEIVEPTGYSHRWKIRFLQYFGRSVYKLGSLESFTVHDGNWEYLEGQDKL